MKRLTLSAVALTFAIAACADPGPFQADKEPKAGPASTPDQSDTQCAMVVRWNPDEPQFPKMVFVGSDSACVLTRNAAAKAAKILVDCARDSTQSCITIP